MSIYTAFGIVGIFLRWTPTCLVVEHKEGIPIFILKQSRQILVQKLEVHQASRYKIIFDAFILNILVNGFNTGQVFQRKTYQRERRFV
jgi:hypothetical protein